MKGNCDAYDRGRVGFDAWRMRGAGRGFGVHTGIGVRPLARFFGFIALAALPACESTGDADFLCERQTGTPCATITDTDVAARGTGGGGGGAAPVGLVSIASSGAPIAQAYRQSEILGTVLIEAHVDGDGIVYEPQTVHFVVQEAGWRRGGGAVQ